MHFPFFSRSGQKWSENLCYVASFPSIKEKEKKRTEEIKKKKYILVSNRLWFIKIRCRKIVSLILFER